MDYEKRAKALKLLKHLSLVQLVLVGLVLILGLVASSQHGESVSGVPSYYVGVFIVGPMAILTAAIGIAICLRGRHCFNKEVAAKKTGCLMQTYCISLPFSGLGSFIAILIASFTGICTDTECSYLEHTGRNYRLAVTIVSIMMAMLISDVFGLVLICMYANHFGVRLFSRGQYRISTAVPNSTPAAVFATNDHSITHFQLQHQYSPRQVQLDTVHSLQGEHLQHSLQLNSLQESQQTRTLGQTDVSESVIGQPVDSDHERAWSYAINATPSISRTNHISDDRRVQTTQRQRQREHGHQHQRSHRKRKRRRKVRPSHPDHSGPGSSYALPPIFNFGLPPPPPSPPPPPNTPPPPLSPNSECASPPPIYYVNEYFNEYVNEHVDNADPPPPYTP